jgi:hypothetical protein
LDLDLPISTTRTHSAYQRVISLIFDNAIHAPDLNHNLISIGRLDKAGCYSVFGGGGMTCLNREGKPFLSGIIAGSEGTMYEVEVYPPTGPLLPKHQNRPLPSTSAAKEAHARVVVFATRSHNKPADRDCQGYAKPWGYWSRV